ncbi:MAG: sensor histidine kinase [Chloroflexia bacterium]
MAPRWSLARQFLLASLLVLLGSGLVIGLWVGRQIEQSMLANAAGVTSLYVDSVISPHLQVLAGSRTLGDGEVAALDQLVNETTLKNQVVTIKVWSVDGRILYSPDHALIGQQFDVEEDLGRAAGGEVVAEVSNQDDPSNAQEHLPWSRLLAVYAPVRDDRNGSIIAVTEFYQLPDRLTEATAAAQRRSWAIVAVLTLATYLGLASIVGRGSATIAKQEVLLSEQVVALSQLLERNAELDARVRQAARRTTTLNEEALRRLSADLHDGPGQVLALALMRLDDLQAEGDVSPEAQAELGRVYDVIDDALRDIRTISSGLLLPEIDHLPLPEVARRAVRDHERRSGTAVALEVDDAPQCAPPAVTIALFRTLQEALSNATRHGRGLGVRVRLWQEEGQLCLTVGDRGPGIAAGAAQGEDGRARLGVAGMRERARLLGGSFALESAAGEGTTVRVRWPLHEPEERWEAE